MPRPHVQRDLEPEGGGWRDAGQVSGGCGEPVPDQLPEARPEDGRRPGRQEKLRDYGNPVLELIGGHASNLSKHVSDLALLISEVQAIDYCRYYDNQHLEAVKGFFLNSIYKEWGLTYHQASARFLLDRIPLIDRRCGHRGEPRTTRTTSAATNGMMSLPRSRKRVMRRSVRHGGGDPDLVVTYM